MAKLNEMQNQLVHHIKVMCKADSASNSIKGAYAAVFRLHLLAQEKLLDRPDWKEKKRKERKGGGILIGEKNTTLQS